MANASLFRPDWAIEAAIAQMAVCTCKSEQVTFCEVCQEYSDCCFLCMAEPKCECVYVREDVTDAADCQLHDPDSHYNDMLRAQERRMARKAASSAGADELRRVA
jgi:nitrate reductase alpha subunit